MTVIRIRFKKLGGHVHCRVFSAKSIAHSFGKAGDLIFDEREWPAILDILTTSKRCEVLPDDEERVYVRRNGSHDAVKCQGCGIGITWSPIYGDWCAVCKPRNL